MSCCVRKAREELCSSELELFAASAATPLFLLNAGRRHIFATFPTGAGTGAGPDSHLVSEADYKFPDCPWSMDWKSKVHAVYKVVDPDA